MSWEWWSQLQQTASEKGLSHCRQVQCKQLRAICMYANTHIPHLDLTTLWRRKHILWHWYVHILSDVCVWLRHYTWRWDRQTDRLWGGGGEVGLEWITFVSPASLPPMYVSLLTRAEKQKLREETERKRKREVSKFNKCLSNQKSNTKGLSWQANSQHSTLLVGKYTCEWL